jgi:hypothetical protein
VRQQDEAIELDRDPKEVAGELSSLATICLPWIIISGNTWLAAGPLQGATASLVTPATAGTLCQGCLLARDST